LNMGKKDQAFASAKSEIEQHIEEEEVAA